MKKTFLLVLLLSISTILFAQQQQFVGSWSGELEIPGGKLPIIFNVSSSENAGLSTTMDSPAQNAKGIPTDKTTVEGKQLTVESKMMRFMYTGTLDSEGKKIKGVFKQNGLELNLELEHNALGAAKVKRKERPQEPKTFPYQREEVTFTNPKAGNQLSGTLTLPESGKASKVVVLISGSGAQDRNSAFVGMDHQPFLVWSDWLTRNGVAVLRYDDRGVGKSTGNHVTATSADFADDVEAAVKYLNSKQDLKGMQIGLMGHSEGGMIAPMVATRNPLVKFMVLLAAPGIPITQLMEKQSLDQLRLLGAPDSVITTAMAATKDIYKAIVRDKDLSTSVFQKKIEQELKLAAGAATQYSTPWFRYFINVNPAEYLSKVKCPVLALNGTLDMQVNSEANLKGIETNLHKAGNRKFEIVSLEGLNHLFQKAKTGSVQEYGELTETVNPAALQKVAAWINKL